MTAALTPDTVLSLAPDAGSASNAKKLATPAKWPTLARPAGLDGVIWGECQGSGAQPYVTGVDLRTADTASKCSCPSRKFPCKHALALLLLHVNGAGGWADTPPPEALQKWLEGRQTRAETPKAPKPEKPADPAAQARRQTARETKITRGLGDLHLWLQDLVRGGLHAARSRPYAQWDGQAARLVDAQAPGAARLVRALPGVLHDEDPAPLLARLGKLALLCEAWTRREGLGEDERADLDVALGQSLDTAALLAGEGRLGRWTVMGWVTEEDGRLDVRRTWLHHAGEDRTALLLDFAPGGRPLPPALTPQQDLLADLRFAPGTVPQRAILAAPPVAPPADSARPVGTVPTRPGTVADLHAAHARALARNPWLERTAGHLGPVHLLPDPAEAHDGHGHAVPLRQDRETLWRWLAYAEGQALYLFGEWDGRVFTPVVASREDEVTHV